MCSPKLAIDVLDFHDDHSNCMWSFEFPRCEKKTYTVSEGGSVPRYASYFSRQFHEQMQIGDDSDTSHGMQGFEGHCHLVVASWLGFSVNG
jgi:hypothetical protein